jgi:isoleucyl-tRNA synthetase
MESKFSAKEKEILKFWQDKKIFEKSLKKDSPQGDYVFYDGPPFATGTPHYGHIPASVIKDVVPRFWTMNGYHIERRWGWDCHGLPVENLVEKDLGIKTKKDIEEKIGVCGFNEACQLSVLKYADVWKEIIPRMGRWVDMDDDYKTMDPTYMESIWWVFKTIYDKGLIYKGYRAAHVCPRCETTLSQMEVSEGYKTVVDSSVTAKFELVDEPKTYFLAWTTTPWTLPGNSALYLNKDFAYVKVKLKGSDELYIVAKDLAADIFDKEFEIVEEYKAKDFVGKSYKPLYDYFVGFDDKYYHVDLADFVTLEQGTGVVHSAIMYGEEDFERAREQGLKPNHILNMDGRFKESATLVKGLFYKDADPVVLKDLKKRGLVYNTFDHEHSYPHCWRCETPLINYATSSWFVEVTKIKDKAIKLAKEINWSPPHLKEGRFGKWLEGAKDWSISRQRFWGSVIPIWQCECGEIKVIGSIKELEEASGKKVTDLHKHVVDEITFKCKCGQEMKRIPDVLDCWFESGSMPYAQVHYPFENEDWFEKNFPAQFIAEGVDQTRAWFYYLHIIGTAIQGKPTFKNVNAYGIVLAEDGKKMSKRLKNYPEPDLVIDKYGADALRYYLLTSPVMEAETLNFSEQGVKEALQKNIILISNILSFYLMYQKNKGLSETKPKNILDKWILAKLNLLKQEVTAQMKDYNLAKATRPISGFINQLSTWYLRRSRQRFKEGDQKGIDTLGYVLLEFSKTVAPFIPFIADDIYRQIGGEKESVHLEDWPEVDKKLIDKKLLAEMELVRQIVEKSLAARAEAGIKVRQPLASYTTSLTNKLDDELVELVKDELNIIELKFGKKDKLETKLSPELKQKGVAREIIRQINQLRKEAKLTIDDKVVIYYDGLDEVFSKFGNEIKKATLATEAKKGSEGKMKEVEGGKVGIKKI